MKLHKLLAGLTFIVFLFLTSCEQEEPHYVRYVANKEGLKVYKNKDGKGEPIATIPYKTRVEVEGEPSKEWVEIEWKDGGKEIEGYVKSEYLSAIEPVEETATTADVQTSSSSQDTASSSSEQAETKSESKEQPGGNKENTTTTKTNPQPVATSTKGKTETKKETKPESKPKTETPKKSSLAAQASATGSYLLTYNKGLKDAQINTSGIYKWNASTSAYGGTYEGSLASNISKITLSPSGNKLKGTVYYSIEEVSPMTGMIETQEKTATITVNPVTGSISVSTGDIKISQAEFVDWGVGKGIILKITSPTTKFILLKKTR